MATTSTERVLNLSDLLENILLFVSVPQLFVVQRVNAAFHDTIARSQSIRRKIFLDESKAEHATNARDPLPAINPLCFEDATYQGLFYPMTIRPLLSKSGSES